MVVSMILVNNPSFVNTPGIQYGIFVAMTLFGPLSMLCIGNRANRILEYCFMGVSCVGALVIAITLLATQTPKASAVSNPISPNSRSLWYLFGSLDAEQSRRTYLAESQIRPDGIRPSSHGLLGFFNPNTLLSALTSFITCRKRSQTSKGTDRELPTLSSSSPGLLRGFC